MFNKFIPVLLPILLFINWVTIIKWPSYFFYLFLIQLALLILFTLKLNRFKFKNKDFWLLLTPGIFLVSLTSVFILFLNYLWFTYLVVFLISLALYYYLTYLYNFLLFITRYKPLSLESVSSYFNLVSYLFLGIIVYGLINFLDLKLWYLGLLIIIITFILTYQFFWISKIDEKNNVFASLLLSILMIEFFWSMSFFPVSHFISGLALAIIYYVVTNLSLYYFLDKLDKKTIKIYLTIGIGCLLIILLSAKWL